jgi:electron transfer flavoprotein alpha subunit
MSVLVITEQTAGTWHNMSFEAIVAGIEVAAALNCPLQVAVIGSGVDALATQAAAKQVSEVVVIDDPALAAYTPDGFAAAVRQAVEQLNPTLVLFPHTYQVRDFAPKLTTGLGKALVSDAIGIRVDDGELVFVRQLFQGKLNADVTLAGDAPHFASVQSGVYRADTLVDGDAPAPIRKLEVSLDASQIRTKPEAPFQESKGAVDLTAADIIVSVGRGIKDPDNIPMARELADAIGGELAASRPICDNGWLPLERQIGSSGQTVSPNLYLALGISGAIQHVVGMKGAKTIVAINKDEGAPIFEIADYGIVADLFEVVPALTEALKNR